MFSVAGVIRRCLDLFQDAIKQNDIQVSFECEEHLRAYGYEDDLQAASMNIIDNPIYWLSTSTDERELEIRAAHRANNIRIAVSNKGRLIDDAYFPRLFDAGFTLKSNGAGLGLAIAREALRRSKGDVTFDGNRAETTFILKTPAIE